MFFVCLIHRDLLNGSSKLVYSTLNVMESYAEKWIIIIRQTDQSQNQDILISLIYLQSVRDSKMSIVCYLLDRDRSNAIRYGVCLNANWQKQVSVLPTINTADFIQK